MLNFINSLCSIQAQLIAILSYFSAILKPRYVHITFDEVYYIHRGLKLERFYREGGGKKMFLFISTPAQLHLRKYSSVLVYSIVCTNVMYKCLKQPKLNISLAKS